MEPIILTLTEDQVSQLQKFSLHASLEAFEGHPGMILGQFFVSAGEVKVGFIPYKTALSICKRDAENNPITTSSPHDNEEDEYVLREMCRT
jgi:hypothetical protein